MLNKIGKVFKKTSGLSKKQLMKNISKSTGRLSHNLDKPIATATNLNKAMPGKIANNLTHNAAKLSVTKNMVKEYSPQQMHKTLEKGADVLSDNLIKNAKHMASYQQIAEFNVPKAMGSAIKKTATAATNVAGSFIKETDKNLLGYTLNTPGKLVLGGAALASGTKQAVTQFNESSMGRRDGQITPHAPRIPAYANNGGATGDLVFALNANRRG